MAIERLTESELPPFDTERMERAVREIIEAVGEDPERQGLLDTPGRVARMYGELFDGLRIDPKEYLAVRFDVAQDEMVLLKDIPFYSMCEHHFMPFHGIAAVGYLPDGQVVGLSKLARLVDGFARRPQLQERLTGQIADAIVDALNPDGVAVVIEAEHLCMTARGVRKPGSRMVTSATRGAFRKNSVTRAEFLSLVRSS
jgi:GTP cyclohydrolase I